MDRDQTSSRAALALAALGVVYGDIGTSPLYAVKETFNSSRGIALDTENILGGLSAIFWALMFVVSLKYVILIMLLGVFGASLFYGDAVLMPAMPARKIRGR